MRLTRKTFFGDYALEEDSEKAKNTAFNKLGQLEDIEEELDIDLFTFYKNYKELLSLSGRNLRITIEEMKRELEK